MRSKKEYQKKGNYYVFNVYNITNNNPSSPPPPPPNFNNVINFDNHNDTVLKTLKDQTTMDVDILLSSSETTRQAIKNKKHGIEEVPRPQNAFMIYRRDIKARLKLQPEFTKMPEAEFSKIIGDQWREEPERVKDIYRDLANIAKRKHHDKYRGYIYKPNRNKSKRKSSKKSCEMNVSPTGSSGSETETPPTEPLTLEFEFSPYLQYYLL